MTFKYMQPCRLFFALHLPGSRLGQRWTGQRSVQVCLAYKWNSSPWSVVWSVVRFSLHIAWGILFRAEMESVCRFRNTERWDLRRDCFETNCLFIRRVERRGGSFRSGEANLLYKSVMYGKQSGMWFPSIFCQETHLTENNATVLA